MCALCLATEYIESAGAEWNLAQNYYLLPRVFTAGRLETHERSIFHQATNLIAIPSNQTEVFCHWKYSIEIVHANSRVKFNGGVWWWENFVKNQHIMCKSQKAFQRNDFTVNWKFRRVGEVIYIFRSVEWGWKIFQHISGFRLLMDKAAAAADKKLL